MEEKINAASILGDSVDRVLDIGIVIDKKFCISTEIKILNFVDYFKNLRLIFILKINCSLF